MFRKGEEGGTDAEGYGAAEGEDDFHPPPGLSPRSRAEFARAALKKAAKKRASKKRRKKKDKEEKKRKKKRRRRKKKKKKKKYEKYLASGMCLESLFFCRGDEDTSDDEAALKPATAEDEHFYPTPRSLKRRRRAFVPVYKPVVCSICQVEREAEKENPIFFPMGVRPAAVAVEHFCYRFFPMLNCLLLSLS